MNQQLKERQGREVEVVLVGRAQVCDIEVGMREAWLLRAWVVGMSGRKTAAEVEQGSRRT